MLSHVVRCSSWLVAALVSLAPVWCQAQNKDQAAQPGVSGQGQTVTQALESFHLRPGFRIECVASEPLVEDPIAFDWSADGRLWVVEMGDYPLGVDGKGKPGGKVRVLTDDDGDGRYDRATTFLEGLSFPNGVAAHREGVLISVSPDILFARDTHGDGRADLVTTLYRGFNESNPQHRANGFAWGLDGWWYCSDGDSDHGITSTQTGKTHEVHGRDFRIHPDTGGFALETARGQYGRQRDDWGNWFANNNSVWAWHAVLSDADLSRNPSLAVASPIQVLEGNRRLYPTSPIVARFNDLDNAGLATSANSPSPYRDDLFGSAYRTSLFVSEPVHNLVHRMVLEPQGSSISGHRAADEETSEFLSSSDNWFRPTQIKTGPDGAVWVADMYRAVIEHPEWIPDDWEAKLDLRAGHDQGRIYRVFPSDTTPRPIPNLARLDDAGLVAALDSANGWQRDTAMRLLLEHGANDQVPALVMQSSRASHAPARLQALATLDGLGALDGETLQVALADPEPEVVRFAAERAGRFAADVPGLADALLGMVEHPSPRVRMGVALGLGRWIDPRAGQALAKLLLNADSDDWIRTAALSSSGAQAANVLSELMAAGPLEQVPTGLLDPLLPRVFRPENGDRHAVARLWRGVTDPRPKGVELAQVVALPSLYEAATRAGFDPGTLAEADRVEIRRGVDRLLEASRSWAVDRARPLADRLAAVRVLGVPALASDENVAALRGLLPADVDAELRRAAIAGLARAAPERAAPLVLEGWKALSPGLRDAALTTLLERPATISGLLFALEEGGVPPAEIPSAIRRGLVDHPDLVLKERARVVFETATVNRAEVLETYRDQLRGGTGQAEAGRAVFTRVCAACHRVQSLGVDVGPDLATLTDRSSSALLVAILDPNRAFEATYTEYVVELRDGRVLSGRIAAETSNGLTLRQTGAKDEVLLRTDIEALASTGRSLMPEGLERDLTGQDLRDLIAFLESGAPPPKTLEGNRPEPVAPNAAGVFRLDARRAAVYGPTLVFEPQFRNLGFWSSEADRALWTLDLPHAGRYAVWLEYACDASAAGNAFMVALDDQRIGGHVPSTGDWSDYTWREIGGLRLEAGRQRLEIRPDGPPRGALLDLRAIELRPLGHAPDRSEPQSDR